MKENPILFKAEMVRAILEGRKTQTRRNIAGFTQGAFWDHAGYEPFEHERGLWAFRSKGGSKAAGSPEFRCMGSAGDRLWVKETFFDTRKFKGAPLFAAAPDFIYRADHDYRDAKRKVIGCHPWKPSIFMPRAASRITLEIVNVRVERLNDISESDAIAEGIKPWHAEKQVFWHNYLFESAHPKRGETITYKQHRIKAYRTAVQSYESLWESINGPGSWAENPWVWVIEFKTL